MFAYAPRVNDESGLLLGQGIVSSAQTEGEAKVKLANDISGALLSVAGAYGQYKGMQAEGKAFKKGMEVLGPSMGMQDTSIFNAMSDMDAYNFSKQFGSSWPALINANSYQQKSQDAVGRMYQQETLRRERDIVNNPPAPAAITVPTGMRRFN